MAKNKTEKPVYQPREMLDGELERAIGEILSAENEAKSVIGQAEAAVKAVQQSAAATERTMRENCARECAAEREHASAEAEARAQKDVADIIEETKKRGDALVAEKHAAVEKRAETLFKELKGK